jgi:hypothetical protein
MFQSQKGIWLLDRGLRTSYIGAPVEAFNSANVLSAVAIPNSNRVLFTLDSGITLMYDYFVGKWGTFVGIPGISSVIYNNLHTFLSAPTTVTPPSGAPYTTPAQVFQETPGQYLDGANPVQMSFVTGWISMAGLQGYTRAYWLYLLGNYISPHFITVGIAYDFNSSVQQLAKLTPTNASGSWGGSPLWGNSDGTETADDESWGGTSDVEQWEIGFQQQTCQAFQISFNEIFDPSKGIIAGAGLTLSAMELVVGLKKGFPKNIPATNKTG